MSRRSNNKIYIICNVAEDFFPLLRTVQSIFLIVAIHLIYSLPWVMSWDQYLCLIKRIYLQTGWVVRFLRQVRWRILPVFGCSALLQAGFPSNTCFSSPLWYYMNAVVIKSMVVVGNTIVYALWKLIINILLLFLFIFRVNLTRFSLILMYLNMIRCAEQIFLRV